MGKLVDFLAIANAAFGRYASAPMTARSHADENAVAVLRAGAHDGLVVELASGSEAPLPSGAATETKQDDIIDAVIPGTWTPAVQVAPADSGVISAAPTTVRSVIASNRTAVTVYLMLFDLAAVPADGAFPRVPFIAVPATSTIQVALGGMACVNGLVWAATSTFGSLTITATTPVVVSAELV